MFDTFEGSQLEVLSEEMWKSLGAYEKMLGITIEKSPLALAENKPYTAKAELIAYLFDK